MAALLDKVAEMLDDPQGHSHIVLREILLLLAEAIEDLATPPQIAALATKADTKLSAAVTRAADYAKKMTYAKKARRRARRDP